MVYSGLRLELPRKNRPTRTIKKTTKPKVVTISLINPPRSYRSKEGKTRIIKLYY